MTPADDPTPAGRGEFRWLFPWQRPRRQLVPGFLAVAAVSVGAAALMTVVRVKVGGPQFEMERRGTLLYLPAAGDGGVWALRAREAGPEITRYNPADWSGYATANRMLLDAAAPQAPGYKPTPRPWQESREPENVGLSIKGVPFLPVRPPAPAPPAAPGWRQVPALRLLTPANGAALPLELPALPEGKPPVIPPDGARFLVRLTPEGGVADCLALSQDDGGNAALASWLRGIGFDRKLAGDGEWFAFVVTYHNAPVDESDNR